MDSLQGPTGFANDGMGISWSLADKFDVHYLGLQSYQNEKIKINIEGEQRTVIQHPNLPRGKQKWDFGTKSLPQLLDRLEPDVLLTVNDIQMVQHVPQVMCPNSVNLQVIDLPSKQFRGDYDLNRALQGELRKFKEQFPRRTKWIQYAPQDGDPPMGQWSNIYRMSDQVVAMSNYGQWVFKRWFGMDTPRIWHGVDTTVFQNTPKDKQFENKFVIGNFNRNQPRKQPVRNIIAFAKFAQDKDDVLLHMQMDWNDQFGWPLQYFGQLYGCLHKMIQPLPVGMPREQVAKVYNNWDLNVNTCFTPDTNVISEEGHKKIKDIKRGDKVLTSSGGFNRVITKHKFKYDGELLSIKPHYIDDIKMTPNHKVFRLRGGSSYKKWIKKKLKENPTIEEVRADELKKGDVLLIPRIKKSSSTIIPNDLLELYGLYLAEGCLSQKKEKVEGLVFSINSKETELTDFILKTMKKYFNIDGKIRDNIRHRRTIWFWSVKVGKQFKDMFGSGAKNKSIPKNIMLLKPERVVYLIKGLWLGDGHIENRDGHTTKYELQTVSEMLGNQLWELLIKCGYIASLHKQQRKSIVYRVSVSGKQDFCNILGTTEDHNRRTHTFGWLDNDYLYTPIRKISTEKYKGDIYDLYVRDIHNYCTPILSHNSGGEGFGLCGIEGYACGIPYICTDYTTSKELIEEGNPSPRGSLVKVKDMHWQKMDVAAVRRSLIDIDDLCDVFNKYYYNRELVKQHGENARKWAEKNVSWKVIAPQWKDVVSKVLSGENGSN